MARMIPSLEQWQSQGQYAAWQGHRVFHRWLGPEDAPVLVLIHGFPSAGWDWHPVLDDLIRDHRVLVPDLLGFGLSDKPRQPYPIADQAQLVLALLEAAGVRQAHLLAHDYGDTVAQELLALALEGRSPVCWQSAALLNGGLFPEAHHPLPIQKLLASPIGPLLVPLLGQKRFEQSLRRIWGNTPPSDEELAVLWALLNHNQGRAVIPRLIQYMGQRVTHRERWVGALVQTAVPLALIDGTADPISGGTLVARFRQLVPQAEVVELDGIGHYPQLEAPEAVLEHWRAFRQAMAQQEGNQSG